MGDGIGDKVLKTNLLDNVKGNDVRSLKNILIGPAAPILRILSWLWLVLNQHVAGGIVQVEGNAGPNNVTGMHVEPRIPHGKVGRRVHVLLTGGTGIATGPIVRCPHVKVGIVLLHILPERRKVGPFSQHGCGRRRRQCFHFAIALQGTERVLSVPGMAIDMGHVESPITSPRIGSIGIGNGSKVVIVKPIDKGQEPKIQRGRSTVQWHTSRRRRTTGKNGIVHITDRRKVV